MRSRRPARQRGHSLTEFVVLGLVIVPLFIIVPLLGKYLDLAHTTALASRYVAWEGTVWNDSGPGFKSEGKLAEEVRRRFFSRGEAPIKTDDAAGDFAAHRNPLWVDHAGNPLLANFSGQVGVTTSLTAVGGFVEDPLSRAARRDLGLPDYGLYKGMVTVKPADVPSLKPFDSIGLQIDRQNTILVDAWTASGPGKVDSRISSGNVLSATPLRVPATFAAPLVLLELGRVPLPDIGHVAPDKVPVDRLKPFKE